MEVVTDTMREMGTSVNSGGGVKDLDADVGDSGGVLGLDTVMRGC